MRARATILDDVSRARQHYRETVEMALDAGVSLGEVRRWLLEEQNRNRAEVLADQATDELTLAGPVVEQTDGPQTPAVDAFGPDDFEQLIGTRVHAALEAMDFKIPEPGDEVTVKIRASGVQLSIGEEEGSTTESIEFPPAPWHDDHWGDLT